jgi:Protein of unknown function (DUF499)
MTTALKAEAAADRETYPFHPRLKNVIALFKENEQFKQTRGLIELVSRLLRSVWGRQANDVFLIGPQHFDLSIAEVRDKLTEISGMRDVIAKDPLVLQRSTIFRTIRRNTSFATASPSCGFSALGLEDAVPTPRPCGSIARRWRRRVEELFDLFDGFLKDKGYLAMGGQIIEATIVSAPKQHNSREDNETPEDWKSKPAKNRQ